MKGKKPVDERKAFEEALARTEAVGEKYVLRLYVTGMTPKSARAIKNIRALCEEQLQGRYELEVIDIYQAPEGIRKEQIVVTPTLVKSLPSPVRRLLGDLSDRERVLVGLDIIPKTSVEKPSKPSGEKDGQ